MAVYTVVVMVTLEQIVFVIVRVVLLGMVVHVPLNVLSSILYTCRIKTVAMTSKFLIFEIMESKKPKIYYSFF